MLGLRTRGHYFDMMAEMVGSRLNDLKWESDMPESMENEF